MPDPSSKRKTIAACLLATGLVTPFRGIFAKPAPIDARFAIAPAPDADSELRSRVKLFYDCYVTGQFRKAQQYVAPDSQDEFFNLAKEQLRSYRIASIAIDENGRGAKVTLLVQNQAVLGGRMVSIDMPLIAIWKWIDGEWYWSAPPDEPARLPMGPVTFSPGGLSTRDNSGLDIPASAEGIAARAQSLPRTFSGLGVPILKKPVLTLNAKTNPSDETRLVNMSRQPLKFRIEFEAIPGVQLTPAGGTLEPGGSAQLEVRISQSAKPPQPVKREGRIVVQSKDGDPAITIQFYVDFVSD